MPRPGKWCCCLLILLSVLALTGCQSKQAVAPPSPTASPHLALGNPSGAADDAPANDNYLLVKPEYALSYNDAKGTPNWVSWRLTESDLGEAPRTDFHPDDALPAGLRPVLPGDYTGSGFDRGHLCPHADRGANDAMSRATFAMSNIIPQSPAVNREAWEQLESYCRELVRQGKVLYTVAGPAGQGGEGSKGPRKTIGRSRTITVPAQCWKVVLVLDADPGGDPTKVDRHARLIAVIMPNDMSVGEDWAPYRVPAAEVEKLTGYTFFDRLPTDAIGPLKQKADAEPIPEPRVRPSHE